MKKSKQNQKLNSDLFFLAM